MTSFVGGLRQGNTSLLLRTASIAAIGGLLFGFDTGVISGALLFIKQEFHANDFEQQAIVSSLLLGAIIGAIISGWAADKLSRKWTKVLSGSVYFFAALGCALSVNVPMLVGFRFLLGVSVGTASFVSPMYISEMAPPRLRGGLVSFNQLAVTTGILVAYLINFAFSSVTYNWRWMLGLGAIPGAALAIGMLTLPHSPRWLAQKDRDDEAREVLLDLREGDPDADADEELKDIQKTTEQESRGLRELVGPKLRAMMVVGLGLAILQQFVGVNTVIYYAPTILKQTGLNNGGAIAQTIAVGVTNVVFTIVAVLLLDRVGRRVLLLTGTAGMIVALAVLGAYFASSTLQHDVPILALVALVVYIASFAIGLGPVFWLMISEIYPLRVRSKAMSVSTVGNWAANFLVAATFLTLINAISRPGAFWLYAGISVLALWFFAVKVPETKERSLEEIQREVVGQGATRR